MPLLLILLLSAVSPPSAVAPPAAMREANESLASGHLERAIALYTAAAARYPRSAAAWSGLGTALYEEARYSEALVPLQRLAALTPQDPRAFAVLGNCHFQLQQYADAFAALTRARDFGSARIPEIAVQVDLPYAMLLTRAGKFEEAFRILTTVEQRSGRTPAITEAAGLASLRKALLPGYLAASDRALIVEAGKASLDFAARRTAEAGPEFEALAATYPRAPGIHFLLGAFLLSGEPDRALTEFEAELKISPSHIPALVSLALELVRKEEGERALPYARQAAELDDASFPAHSAYGQALIAAGSLQQGIAELERAIALAPQSAVTHVVLSAAYRKAGRTADAERERAIVQRLQAQ